MTKILLVAAGSAIGGVLRYLFPLVIQTSKGGFPWTTLSVNAVGSLLIGLFSGLAARHFGGAATGECLRALLVVGFCGGFTTFSTFSNETFRLLGNGQALLAAVYALGSILAGLAAVGLGLWLAGGGQFVK